MAAALAVCGASLGSAAAATAAPGRADRTGQAGTDQALEAFANLPLTFVENQGQVGAGVRYHAHGSDFAFAVKSQQVVMSFAEDTAPAAPDATRAGPAGARGVNVALRFLGANQDVQISSRGELDTRVNYVRGDDPDDWYTGLAAHEQVVYSDLWPGVNMVLRGADGELKYEFRVQPGADVRTIRLAYEGAQRLALDPDGGLRVKTALGELRDSAPVSFQDVAGVRVHVESRFVLGGARGNGYRFAVGDYDRSRELVIDPGLDYSTFVGGSSMDRAEGVTVDANGNAIVVGATQSTDFPATAGAVGTTFRGGIMDAFVAKLNADGSALMYATYLGGTPMPTRRGNVDNTETARAVTVDASGNAYVTGQTSSGDFPVTGAAFQGSLSVGEQTATDAFVTKLGPTGALAYSTFLGGQASDDGRSIAVDSSGNAYVGGSTFAADFPTTTGAFDTTHNGGEDGYVAKLNATGSSLVYSTLLGGAENELPDGVAVDASGNAYLAGSTRSVEFPTTAGSFQAAHSGGGFADLFEGFVTKLNPSGSGLVYSTFLGGTRIDRIGDLTLDPSGNAYVVGGTQSAEFPTTSGVLDTAFNETSEGFVTKLNAAGSALEYSTFFRGGSSITLDAANNAWLAGGAAAGAPTTADAFQPQNNGGNDAYIAQLDATGSTILHATYLGGTDNEGASGIALDADENIYIAGTTMSADFPTTPGAFDRVWNGDASIFWGDAFAAKFAAGEGGPQPPVDTTPPTVDITAPAAGATVSGTVSVEATATDDVGVTGVQFFVDGVPIGTDTTAPYAVPWNTTTAAEGSHILTAQASDAAGNTGNAQSVTVTVDNVVEPVTTTLTAQIDRNQTLTRTVSIGVGAVNWTLSWNESRVDLDLRGRDPNGNVVFFDGGNARPKSGTFSATVAGDHTFQIINNTRRRTSYTLSVTHPPMSAPPPPSDTVSPTVSVTNPAAQSTVSGTVSVTADASDNVGVARVEFIVDDSVVIATDSTAPYGTSWDTTGLADGLHSLTARAFDAAGNASAHRIPVTVDNTVEPPADTTAPTVSITSPAATSTVSGTVAVQATASDDVGVTEVRFFVDGTSIGTDTTAPYEVSWDTTGLADGPHTLSARATDAAGNTGNAQSVTVTVDNTVDPPADTTAPSVSITNPATGSTVSGTVSVQATATDDTGVTEVRFFADGALISGDSTAPFQAPWDTTGLADGSHTLTASAFDAAGNVDNAQAVNVTVDNTPDPQPERTTATFSGEIDDGQTITHTVNSGTGTVDWALDWDETRVNLSLRVLDPAGNVVLLNNSTAKPKTGSFQATIAGSYRFQIITTSDRDADYTLQITHPPR